MNVIIKFFQDGGFWMYPILIVGILGLAFAAERFIKLKMLERSNRKTWEALHPVLAEGDFEQAREMVSDNNSAVAQMLSMGLEVQGTVRRRDDIEVAMEEAMMEITPQLEARTVYISMFANISTLLGLLGTIIGLISAFEAVANANPAEKSALLSSSIAMAMNTTAFGLIAAIPLLVCYNMVSSKTAAIVGSLEMISVKTLKLIGTFTRRSYQQSSSAANELPGEKQAEPATN
ncbi:MAG: MotA/TolQ/ExbB proton channel family protein [Pseudomonadales bacterium]|nr:MotA/TolQ/ExbB proton channel family protein [Pseudomonadales bacterium]